MADTKGIRAGRAFVELGVSDRLSAGLRRAERRLKAFGEGVRAIGARLAALGAVAVAPLAASIKQFANVGDALDEAAARTGISVEALSELAFAAELSGADLETLEAGVRHLQKSLVGAADGTGGAADALASLGLRADQLRSLAPEDQFSLIAERLSRVLDPAKRTALALALLGRQGARLLPLMQRGAAGIDDLRAQARALGLTVSTQAARDAAELNDALDSLWRVVRNGAFVIGAALAPAVLRLTKTVTRVIVSVTEWIKQNRAVVVSVAKVVAIVLGAGAAIVALGLVISGIGAAVGVMASIVSGVGAVFGVLAATVGAILSPIGLVVAAVVGLGGALLVASGVAGRAIETLSVNFRGLAGTVSRVVGGIADALAAGDIALAAKVLWLSLRLAWQEGAAALNGVWLTVKRFFVGTAQEMWFGALAAAEIAWHALEVGWIETTAFLSKTWARFSGGFQSIWQKAVSFVAKRMLEIQGLFDSGLDVEAAKRGVDEDLERRLSEIDTTTQRDIDSREQRRARERDRTRQLNEDTLAEISRQFEEAQRALEKGGESSVEETRRALEEARRRLDEAIEEARRQREETSDDSPSRAIADRLAGLEDLITGAVGVRGTFNAAALQGLASGGDAAERTARATEQTARHARRIADAAQSSRLVFT